MFDHNIEIKVVEKNRWIWMRVIVIDGKCHKTCERGAFGSVLQYKIKINS